MILPYDIFNHIITHVNVKTLWHLSYTNKTIRNICNHYPFYKVLSKVSNNKYFNLNVKSDILDQFLNNITDGDKDLLKELQCTFGIYLSDDEKLNSIVYLYGNYYNINTIMCMIIEIFDHSMLNLDNYPICFKNIIKKYKIVNISLDSDMYFVIKSLCHQFNDLYFPEINIIIPTSCTYDDKTVFNIFKQFKQFKLLRLTGYPIINMSQIPIGEITNDILSSFLNFLLQGCKDVLNITYP